MSEFTFVEKASTALSFLEEHRFSRVRADDFLIEYQNHFLGVSLFFEPRTGDLDTRVFRTADQAEKFELGLFAAWIGDKNASDYECFVVGSNDGLITAIQKCADGVSKNLPYLLNANEDSFARLKAFREERASAMAVSWNLPGILQRAEQAWIENKFSKVVELLSSVERHLTPAQIKKLELAKKYAA